MPLHIVHQDITEMETDAIVNAANTKLLAGGGVCGAIFKKANSTQLTKDCAKLSPIPVGDAVITKGYHLKAKYIIHAVGPIYQDGHHQEEALLKQAYQSALDCACSHDLKSISFPLISSGIYGYPKKAALEVAVSVISQFLKEHEMDIYLVVFDKSAVEISEKLYHHVQHYIETYYVETRRFDGISMPFQEDAYSRFDQRTIGSKPARSLDHMIDNIQESFSEVLLKWIDLKHFTDVEIYKRANLDRKLFSKIRSQKDYHPSKKTVLALAIALELSLDETDDLLERAGYSLSFSQKQDIIIRYFIEHHEYDIYTINETLFYFNEATL